MIKYNAYIDETGEPIFSEGSSKTFFLCAIVMNQCNVEKNQALLSHIKSKYKVQHLKSSKMHDFSKRLAICEELAQLDIQIATINVKKDKLNGEWFRVKPTFYKYIQSLLNHRLYQSFGTLDVSIDRFGSLQYQTSIKQYLEKKLQGELFEPEIQIDTALTNEFIQVSDFIGGSLRKAMQGDFEKNEGILQLFTPIWPIRENLPDEGKHIKPIPDSESSAIYETCMGEAYRYLTINQKNNRDVKYKTLEYLYYSAIEGNKDWLLTPEILSWLNQSGIVISEEQFRNTTTASLRDEGLIIASSRKGIKIPCSADDFNEYISFSVNLVLPVLRRLKKAITYISERMGSTETDTIISDEMKKILYQVEA